MRKLLGALSVLGLSSASFFVVWSVVSRPDGGTHLPPGSARGFSYDYVQPLPPAPVEPAPAASPLRAPEELRDALAPAAPASSPLPVPYQGMLKPRAVEASAAAPARRPALKTLVSGRHETWALQSGALSSLMSAPVRYLASSTALSSPRALLSFLDDKKKVEAYMDSPLVRIVLNSPAVARKVLGSRALARAFLSTPAMRNPRAARALVSSPLARKMLSCPGVTQALADPAVVKNLVMDGETGEWLAEHPEAVQALTQAVPSLGSYLATRP